MQTLKYRVGKWHAEARVEELAPGKLMAVILVSGGPGDGDTCSRHTVVFEPAPGQDPQTGTGLLVQRLLRTQYGYRAEVTPG
jgi:hypothetical protein